MEAEQDLQAEREHEEVRHRDTGQEQHAGRRDRGDDETALVIVERGRHECPKLIAQEREGQH